MSLMKALKLPPIPAPAAAAAVAKPAAPAAAAKPAAPSAASAPPKPAAPDDAVRALTIELNRLKSLLDTEQRAHGARMQRGADDAWEAAARIAAEALGRAKMPSLDIWDPGFDALNAARTALRALQMDAAADALRRAAAALQAARKAIRAYDDQLETGGERSITALEGAKVAGAVAAGVATGGVATAAELGVVGSAVAAGGVGGLYGAGQELAGEASATYIADTKRAIDWKAVLRRGATDAVTGFVGGIVGGKLTERFCRMFGSYLGPAVTDAELKAMGQALGLAGPLERTAFMTAAQKFMAEFLSGTALVPVQQAITLAINRVSGGAPGPKNMEEFMDGVAHDVVQGGVVQLLVTFLTHKMPPARPGAGKPTPPPEPAASATGKPAASTPVVAESAVPAKPATGKPAGGTPVKNEPPMATLGEGTAPKAAPGAAPPLSPHGEMHKAAPPATAKRVLPPGKAANDNVELPHGAAPQQQPAPVAEKLAEVVQLDTRRRATGQQADAAEMAMASGDRPGRRTAPSGGPPGATPPSGTQGPAVGGPGAPSRPAFKAPPVKRTPGAKASTLGDVSFPMGGPRQPTPKVAEALVGRRLEANTGLKALPPDAPQAAFLKTKPKPGGTPGVTQPMLLEQPVITGVAHPDAEGKRAPLGSVKPDYLYLAPKLVEVVEITKDSGFQDKPQLRNLSLSGSTERAGLPRKQGQIQHTLQHLIERFPDCKIVYNVQAHGPLTPDVQSILESQLNTSKAQLAAAGKGGTVQIVWRGETEHTFE